MAAPSFMLLCPARPSPHLSRKSLRRAQRLFNLSVSGGSPCHSAGTLFSTEAMFSPGWRALTKSHCLEGTLEPQAEWPLHTLNSTKAWEVGDTSFTWLVNGWFSPRIVLPPKRPVFPLHPSGPCPLSGGLGEGWSLLAGGFGSNLSKENRQKI